MGALNSNCNNKFSGYYSTTNQQKIEVDNIYVRKGFQISKRQKCF